MMIIPEMVRFNRDGLVPVITQDIRTDEVLMLAYMNEEALKETIRTGMAHYYSRSRQKLWLKGETSGHYQKVRNISVDCDGDALLIKAEQTGAACHTGHHSCFYTKFDMPQPGIGTDMVQTDESSGAMEAKTDSRAEICGDEDKDKAGPEVLTDVFSVILSRRAEPKEGSYTNYLFAKGLDKILKKIGEETSEVIIASKNKSSSEIKAEIADLLYHIMVLLAERGMTLTDVFAELKKRA